MFISQLCRRSACYYNTWYNFFFMAYSVVRSFIFFIYHYYNGCRFVPRLVGSPGVTGVYMLPPNQLWYFGSRDTAASVLSIQKPRTSDNGWSTFHWLATYFFLHEFITHVRANVHTFLWFTFIYLYIYIYLYAFFLLYMFLLNNSSVRKQHD